MKSFWLIEGEKLKMTKINIMDASAILAYLQEETGEHIVEAALEDAPCWITTINACEVLSKLCEKGRPINEAQIQLYNLNLFIVDFDLDLALRAAALRSLTSSFGASLGDRACLAFAQRAAEQHSPVVYTTDHNWSKIKWPFKVTLLRSRKA